MARKMLHVVVALVTMTLPLVIAAPAAHADDAGDLFAMINDLRASSGRPALVADPTLTAAAQKYTARMVASGTVANADLASLVPAGWAKLGENVASGGTLLAIFNTWRDQPDHRALLLDPAFTLTGVAVLPSSDGTTLFVSEFLETLRPATVTTTSTSTTTTTTRPTTTTTTTTTAPTTTTSTTSTTTSTATTTTTTALGAGGPSGSTSTTVAAGSGSGSAFAAGPGRPASHRAAGWIFAVAAAAAALLALVGAGIAGGRQPSV